MSHPVCVPAENVKWFQNYYQNSMDSPNLKDIWCDDWTKSSQIIDQMSVLNFTDYCGLGFTQEICSCMKLTDNDAKRIVVFALKCVHALFLLTYAHVS